MRATVLCLGMAVWDRILSLPAIPTAPVKTYGTELRETGGGPAATAAVTVARLGGAARLVGRVGDDPDGARIAEELACFGVDTRFLARLPGARSGTSSVGVDPAGERLILNYPGRGLHVPPDWLDWDAAMAEVGCVLVDMGWPLGAARALAEAQARGIPTMLDADLNPYPEAAALVPLADHAVFSEPGLAALTGMGEPEAALRSLDLRATAGVTLGARGYLWRDAGGLHEAPGLPVEALDTLGAGDCFHGALSLAIAEGVPMARAARFANAAAALKCTRPGGRLGLPTRAEVDALL
ncbi:PfkB family carbohydrate kinase [Roseomonas sp. CCTCC AB2023176]|uniref:PfkB family carbohydrate kinase n=1 Tax=Roseomonas sp. CCTCC AB2023176 TaxID=3342640 RepID=UPI0035E1CB16